MECIVCKRDMVNGKEIMEGIETSVWYCLKCGRRIVDREPLLKKLAAPT